MNRSITFLILITIFLIPTFSPGLAINEITIWNEFIQLVKDGEFTADRIRPYFESLRQTNMDFVTRMTNETSQEELDAEPEIIRTKERINYLIPITFNQSKVTYCLSFIEEGDRWYLQHIESIFIRLDKLPPLPTSDFPDLSDQQKNWARSEIYWTEQVRLFNFLSKEKGKDFAFNWFKDGAGYFLAAKSWVPFVEHQRAFILYLCWEQAKLRGNEVSLEKLAEKEAVVRIGPQFIKLYLQTSHLKQQISFEDYIQLFNTIWQDRAEKAGWNLEIMCGGWPITFHFKIR